MEVRHSLIFLVSGRFPTHIWKSIFGQYLRGTRQSSRKTEAMVKENSQSIKINPILIEKWKQKVLTIPYAQKSRYIETVLLEMKTTMYTRKNTLN